MLEVASAAAFIGNNAKHARKWIDHTSASDTYPAFGPALQAAVALMGGTSEHREILQKQHQEACMSKHSNPHTLRQIGILAAEDHLDLVLGPYFSDDIVRVTRLVLGRGARYVIIGAWAFSQNHSLTEERRKGADSQLRGLEATLRDLERIEIVADERRKQEKGGDAARATGGA
jgi:hypothetical protein